MLHNIVQKKKIPIPDTQEDEDVIFDQPGTQTISNDNRASRSKGLQLLENLLNITNKLPLRKQIVLKPK